MTFISVHATAGVDYMEVATAIQFAPLEKKSCVNISIIDNHIIGEDGVKSFTVTLFSDDRRVVIEETRASAQIFIQENDGMSKIKQLGI